MNDAVHETSFTEIAQELILLITSLLYFRRVIKASAPGLILIGGFFACMLIRELDFLFDALSHGSWVWFALATAAACLAIALLNPRRVVMELADFLRQPDCGMMCAGLPIVLVFSRLFGMRDLWQHLMLNGYNHTVKNMVEEGCELLGYSLCLLATCSYLYGSRAPQENVSGPDLQ